MLIRPLPFVALAVRPEVLDPGRRLAYTYLAGPFRGRGVWTVAAEGALASRVTYEIALLPVNRLVALAASTPLFRAKHRRDIAAIIERLAAACGGAA